jgi:phage tail sheath gpL-like
VDRLVFVAKNSGEAGNQIDFRINYYEGQSNPLGLTISNTALAGGANNPDLGDVWAVVANEQYQHIVNPYTDAGNLTELEGELSTRFGPMVDLQGFGWTAYRGAAASCTTIGNTRNSPHNNIMGVYDTPSNMDEWAAVVGGVAGQALESDPARPVQLLQLPGVLPPPVASRFTRAERNVLLFDGISTFLVDSGGNVITDRLITTYQKTALGTPDPSYLDVETMFTLMEIRYQYKNRMVVRFLAQRFKLADDTFPVQGGQKIATPSTIKQEIIALFALLRDNGLIENLDDFVTNLIVQRNSTDVNRVDVLLAPDLINQFRILASQIQFIL